MKRVIRSDYSDTERNKWEGKLVSNLEVLINKGIATDVLIARMVLDQFLNVTYEGFVIRAKVHVLKYVGTKLSDRLGWQNEVFQKSRRARATRFLTA